MNKINVLSEDLINKIAAGEVIERPASVVKELVENSLDAGATKVVVNIKNSGKDLIKVTDDGYGMQDDDAKKAILRHATSKLQTVDDLFNITTLGFRGEALASIAAVSQLSIITKPQGKLEAFNLIIEGGLIISEGITAGDQGTSIEVRNLFFNTPVRKNFLRTDAVELGHIIEVITHYALFNNHISFTLKHDGHQLLHSPAVLSMRENIASIYGSGLARDLLEVSYTDDLVAVNGFVAKPHAARNDKNQQALFINGRWVRNTEISKSVYAGFHSMLFVGKHPIFVLHLDLNPKKVDVNVHPQKLDVKIDQGEVVCRAVRMAVNETLSRNNLIPLVDVEFETKPISKTVAKYNFDASKQTFLEIKQVSPQLTPLTEDFSTSEEIVLMNPTFPEIKVLGQVHKTFWVAETPGGVFFIDQHAAHERVLYEKFMDQHASGQVDAQKMLQGEVIDLSVGQAVLVADNRVTLSELGFHLEPFGNNSFVLKTVPSIFGRLQPKELMMELISEMEQHRTSLDEIREIIVTRMACRSAVMAGDDLTTPYIEGVLRDLSKTKNPFTCPHGRPTMIKTTADELEKKFKRKG